jgi:hypothetical protein
VRHLYGFHAEVDPQTAPCIAHLFDETIEEEPVAFLDRFLPGPLSSPTAFFDPATAPGRTLPSPPDRGDPRLIGRAATVSHITYAATCYAGRHGEGLDIYVGSYSTLPQSRKVRSLVERIAAKLRTLDPGLQEI